MWSKSWHFSNCSFVLTSLSHPPCICWHEMPSSVCMEFGLLPCVCFLCSLPVQIYCFHYEFLTVHVAVWWTVTRVWMCGVSVVSQSLLPSPPCVVLVDTYIIFLKLSWHLSTLYSYNWLLKNLFSLKKTQILLGCAECMHILRNNLCLCNIKLFHPGLHGTFKVLRFCSKPSYFPC